jgi:hypothetical protein
MTMTRNGFALEIDEDELLDEAFDEKRISGVNQLTSVGGSGKTSF